MPRADVRGWVVTLAGAAVLLLVYQLAQENSLSLRRRNTVGPAPARGAADDA